MRWTTSTEDRSWFTTTPAAGAADVNLELAAPQRDWQGFGCCFNELGTVALNHLSEAKQAELRQRLFGAGEGDNQLTRCRMPIGANDYATSWYSHADQAGDHALNSFTTERDAETLFPQVRAAMAINPALSLFVSPWSPPAWLKFPQAHNHGRLIWDSEHRSTYARYLLKAVAAYRAAGLPVDALHVQNEPDSDQKFPSCCWTGATLRDFIRDDLGPLVERECPDLALWLGTIERGDHNAWVIPTLVDPEARRYCAGVGFQWAGKAAIPGVHASFPDLPLAQTEHECGNGTNTWDYAHYGFDLACHYLRNGVTSYCWWNPWLEPGGNSTWGWHQNSLYTIDTAGTVTENPDGVMFRHLCAAGRPGSKVLATSGSWSANARAWSNSDGSTGLALHNPIDQDLRISIAHAGTTISGELPAHSFHTVVLD
ncbi:MAG: glycosyl hydrolase [Planctomycetota bacterium]|jgi:glucosylceramidase|nr:glycosyl hydrolase [Planctomycetota bacterium]